MATKKIKIQHIGTCSVGGVRKEKKQPKKSGGLLGKLFGQTQSYSKDMRKGFPL